MKHMKELYVIRTSVRGSSSVSFARKLNPQKTKDRSRVFVMYANQNEMKEKIMDNLLEEFGRMQMQYKHILEGLLMKAFHKRFKRTMTTLEAIDCRVEHKLGGSSIYYHHNVPFLEVESMDVKIEETDDKILASLPLEFTIILEEGPHPTRPSDAPLR